MTTFLQPIVQPLEGQPLLDFLQGWLVGVSGYPGENVRPRWQTEPANLPLATVDWMSFGIMSRVADSFPYESEDPSGTFTNYIRHEELRILLSFYGPNADSFAAIVRDGIFLPWNNEYLFPQSMNVHGVDDLVNVSEIVKFQWYKHFDLPIALRRKLVYNYAIESLLSVTGTVTTVTPSIPVLNINVS